MKEFKLPITDERITSMTSEQVDLILWSMILDRFQEAGKATYFEDTDFEEEWEAMEPEAKDSSSEVWEEVE